jgi:hypothetical protein
MKPPINVLSVDWDYFFPALDGFDWGHSETNPLFAQIIWATRPGSQDLFTKERAIDVVHPHVYVYEFWLKTIINNHKPSPRLCIAESHKDIMAWLKELRVRKANVTNFDAHHDMGYKGYGFDTKVRPPVDCGNWARVGIDSGAIGSYRLVYPSWRKRKSEGGEGTRQDPPFTVKYGDPVTVQYEPPLAQAYDLIFICRSSSWTPSWSDDKWLEFINWWQSDDVSWAFKCYVPFVLKARAPDTIEARKLADEWDKLMESFQKKQKARIMEAAKV